MEGMGMYDDRRLTGGLGADGRDEAVGKERSLCIVFLSHHYEALVPNQLGKVLALTCEAAIHFSHIVHPC